MFGRKAAPQTAWMDSVSLTCQRNPKEMQP